MRDFVRHEINCVNIEGAHVPPGSTFVLSLRGNNSLKMTFLKHLMYVNWKLKILLFRARFTKLCQNVCFVLIVSNTIFII